MINIELSQAQTDRIMRSITRNQRYATQQAINKTAFNLREHIQQMMRAVFDRPTPFMLKSVRVNMARGAAMHADVGFFEQQRSGAVRAIAHHFGGGNRRFKGIEGLLYGRSLIPPGMQAVPGKDAKLNAFGNMTNASLRAAISRIANTGHGSTFASPGTNNLSPGFYKRIGQNNKGHSKLQQILSFVRPPNYRKRMDMQRMANFVIARDFDTLFAQSLSRALSNIRV